MIRHIFKIIWNERKSNVLIVLEFIVVFCILWFCCDFLYWTGKSMLEAPGLDIDHTYILKMERKTQEQFTGDEQIAFAMLLKERVRNYPGVEYVSFSNSAIPYTYRNSMQGYIINNDSVQHLMSVMWVTPEYFDVFKIPFTQGLNFTDEDMDGGSKAIISPNRYGYFGEKDAATISAKDVNTLKHKVDGEDKYTVIGITGRQKKYFYETYRPIVFHPMEREGLDLRIVEVAIRVSPQADNNFAEKFMEDMESQLMIGPYFAASLTPTTQLRQEQTDARVTSTLNSVLAITLFLIVNIFLGLIGTFWSRTQARRTEIGLRIALGSSGKKVMWMMFAEVVIMLFLSGIVATYICLNLGQTDLLNALGIPVVDKFQAGFGIEQNLINYVTTFAFLALVSGAAVWYPARQAAKTPPAEALKDE